MPNQFNATTLAARLGVTREDFPEWFEARKDCLRCGTSDCGVWRVRCLECGFDGTPEGQPWYSSHYYVCTLPDPRHPTDPRAKCWEPFLMRALGWPTICTYTDTNLRTEYKVNDRMGATWEPTPTAALAAAYDAKEAK
jgi:hypothetical protein